MPATNRFIRVWLRVHQPRVISVLYFAIYAIAAADGIMCSVPAEMGPVT